MNEKSLLPKDADLYKPILEALVTLGGSGSNEEIDDAVITGLKATQEQLDIKYAKSGVSILVNRIAWARTSLKTAGLTENRNRGVWVLTEKGRAAASKSPTELKTIVNKALQMPTSSNVALQTVVDEPNQDFDEQTNSWLDLLLGKIQSITPEAFERLCQRLLRESGFMRVEVTGKSGDGGIDGVGVLRVNLISFQVLFQCKRYKGSVSSEVVRNFRGAMMGRADKGLIITTGTFTSEARKEATRDGAPAIDLIDGEALCTLMEERRLGVQVKEVIIKEICLDEGFFASV